MDKIDYKTHLEVNEEQKAEQYAATQKQFQKTMAAKKMEVIAAPESGDRTQWYNTLRRRARETAKAAKDEGYFYVYHVTVQKYQQAMLHALGLTVADAELLAYFERAFKSAEYKKYAREHEGRTYFWVSRSSIVRAFPLLGVTSDQWMYEKMKKLLKAGVMFSHTFAIKSGESRPAGFAAGQRALYAVDDLLLEVLKETVDPD
jgi:hypothetical protein